MRMRGHDTNWNYLKLSWLSISLNSTIHLREYLLLKKSSFIVIRCVFQNKVRALTHFGIQAKGHWFQSRSCNLAIAYLGILPCPHPKSAWYACHVGCVADRSRWRFPRIIRRPLWDKKSLLCNSKWEVSLRIFLVKLNTWNSTEPLFSSFSSCEITEMNEFLIIKKFFYLFFFPMDLFYFTESIRKNKNNNLYASYFNLVHTKIWIFSYFFLFFYPNQIENLIWIEE